jgi:hypothetical protein
LFNRWVCHRDGLFSLWFGLGAGIGFPGIYPVNGPVLILFPTEMGFSGIFFPHKRFLVKVEPFLCLIFLSY